MTAEIIKHDDDEELTIQVKVKLTGSLFDACNEVGTLVHQTAKEQDNKQAKI